MTASPPEDRPAKPKLSPREERLKAALRDNLRRRKAAAVSPTDPKPEADG